MSQDIFKIYYLEHNNLYNIDIFSGDENVTDSDIFDEKELNEIEEQITTIHYHKSRIFFDDTIYFNF